MHQAEGPGNAGGDQHTDQNGAADFLDFKRDHQNQAEERESGGGVADIAHADECGGIADDEAGVAKPDERDEEADAAGHCCVKFMGNRAQDHLADARSGEREKDQAGKKHRAQRRLPWDVHFQADGVGKVGVESHARRERDGIARNNAHEN